MVGTDANDDNSKGIPRKANYWYDVKSEVELKPHGIEFLSAQDLEKFYYNHEGKAATRQGTGYFSQEPNIYRLAEYFVQRNPEGRYFLDEVPLIKGIP